MEFPHFQQEYISRKGQFELISVTHSSSSAPQDFVKQASFSWTFVMDPGDAASTLYGVQAFPTTLFIGRDGRIVDRVEGSLDQAGFEAELAKIL